MIEIALAHSDLARVRFAHSPTRELMESLRVLRDPCCREVYGRWIASVRGRLDRVNLPLLTALSPAGPHLPGFMSLPPTDPWPTLCDELAAIATTSPDWVRSELGEAYQGQPMPPVLATLYEDPAEGLPAVVAELEKYWQVAMEPVWGRIRTLAMADVSYRLEQFGVGGVARVFSDLHPEVSLHGNRLRIDKPRHHHEHRYDLLGTGMHLVPCVFSWPRTVVNCCDTDKPFLSYPARGLARLGPPEEADRAALGTLLGKTRAQLLDALDLPRTTTELADELALSPATVSHHLEILKSTALVHAQRRGRIVLYQRTAAATALLSAAGGSAG